MYDELWAGANIKCEYALFHLVKMQEALNPPLDAYGAAMVATGAIVDTGWRRTIFPHLDAFLVSARSVPEIIECCFGEDTRMKKWLQTLPVDEQDRRALFSQQFNSARGAFCDLRLGKIRNTSFHRRGYADVEVRIMGRFGVAYVGGPANPVPMSETREITDPTFPPGLARPMPIEPRYTDFTIDGQPLFAVCRDYLNRAQELITEGRTLVTQVHGTNTLTPPPDA